MNESIVHLTLSMTDVVRIADHLQDRASRLQDVEQKEFCLQTAMKLRQEIVKALQPIQFTHYQPAHSFAGEGRPLTNA